MSEDVCARVNNRPADAGGAEAGTSTRGVEEVNSERFIYVDSGLDRHMECSTKNTLGVFLRKPV